MYITFLTQVMKLIRDKLVTGDYEVIKGGVFTMIFPT